MSASFLVHKTHAENFGGVSATKSPHSGYADYHPSCVQLDDGRILVMYSRGTEPGNLYQAYVSDLNTFLTTNDSITSEETVLSDMYYPRATMFFAPDGYLYFVLAYTKTTTSGSPAIKVYKSTLRDGSDWSLRYSNNGSVWSSMFCTPDMPISAPIFNSGDSSWHLLCPKYQNASPDNSLLASYQIYKITNNGTTWVSQYGTPNGYMKCSRNIAEQYYLYWATWYSAGAYNSTRFVKGYGSPSLTWIEQFSQTFVDTTKEGTIYNFDDTLNFIDNADNIYEATDPLSAWTDFADSGENLSTHDANTIITRIGNTDIILGGESGMTVSYVVGETFLQRIRL